MGINRLTVTVALSVLSLQAHSGEPTNGRLSLESVHYFRQNDVAGQRAVSPVTRLSEPNGGLWGKYDVVATLTNRDAPHTGYFVLASVDMIVAPRQLPPELTKHDVVDSVGWGYLTTMESMHTQVVSDLPTRTPTRVALMTLDVDAILEESFSSDDLWPWAMRVTVRVVDRYGVPVASGEGILRIDPPNAHTSGDLSPN